VGFLVRWGGAWVALLGVSRVSVGAAGGVGAAAGVPRVPVGAAGGVGAD